MKYEVEIACKSKKVAQKMADLLNAGWPHNPKLDALVTPAFKEGVKGGHFIIREIPDDKVQKTNRKVKVRKVKGR
jgi:hypothetical protein